MSEYDEINYSKFSLQELEGINLNIDKQRFPKRNEALQIELVKKRAEAALQPFDYKKSQTFNKKLFVAIIFLISCFLFLLVMCSKVHFTTIVPSGTIDKVLETKTQTLKNELMQKFNLEVINISDLKYNKDDKIKLRLLEITAYVNSPQFENAMNLDELQKLNRKIFEKARESINQSNVDVIRISLLSEKYFGLLKYTSNHTYKVETGNEIKDL